MSVMMMMQSGEEGGEEKEVLVALLRQAVRSALAVDSLVL